MGKRKKMLVILSTTIILVFCFFVVLYILGIRGDAYQVSLEFIDNNKLVSENIGQITNRRLALFGYAIRKNGPHGHAEYKITVKGTKSKGTVYLTLEKSAGVWRVTQGNLMSDNRKVVSILGND